MASNKIAQEGLTFDDVLVLPRYSNVLPRDVNTRTKLTKNISINIPIVSAAMDTVTESRLAIAMAREGGIGMVHKNMSIEQQANEVRKVKRSESGMILDPITLPKEATLSEALDLMTNHKIGGIPIVDEDEKLIGIITNRDLRFQRNLGDKIEGVMTKGNLVTAKKGTSLKEAENILQQYKIEKLPITDETNKLIGLIKGALIHYEPLIIISSHHRFLHPHHREPWQLILVLSVKLCIACLCVHNSSNHN
jgi:IMP dehydrogenase